MDNCINNIRCEYGSEYHLIDYQFESGHVNPWQQDNCRYMGSGRDAIRLLLNHGVQQRGWLRLWIPDYFCQEVVEATLSSSIAVMVYENNPFEMQNAWERIPFKAGDVLFVVNYFGLGRQPNFTCIEHECVEIIEDHTHDPWSDWARKSEADWCVASLRKTIPIPDGGVLWSPRSLRLPDAVDLTIERKNASLEKLASMLLKKYYLEGLPVRKKVFRELALNGEGSIASGEISAMSPWTREMLNGFPIEKWRKMRIHNYSKLSDLLKKCKWLEIPMEVLPGTCPLSVPILFDKPARRDYVRERLIECSVYPAILWDLNSSLIDGISASTIDISRRILCIHCDMRYDEQTMEYLANLIIAFANQYDG